MTDDLTAAPRYISADDTRALVITFHKLQRAYLAAALADIDMVDAMWMNLAMDCDRADVAQTDAKMAVAEAYRKALEAMRGAGSFGRTPKEQHAALEQYCLCRDAILALADTDALAEVEHYTREYDRMRAVMG